MRRFLLHLLPKGFVRIRHFGLANGRRVRLLPLCVAALDSAPAQAAPNPSTLQNPSPLWPCPKCGGTMVVVERLTAAQIQLRAHPPPRWLQHELSISFRKLPVLCRATPTCVLSPNHSQLHTLRHDQCNHLALPENCPIGRLLPYAHQFTAPPSAAPLFRSHSISIGPRPPRERLPSDGFIERARQHLFLITFRSARVR